MDRRDIGYHPTGPDGDEPPRARRVRTRTLQLFDWIRLEGQEWMVVDCCFPPGLRDAQQNRYGDYAIFKLENEDERIRTLYASSTPFVEKL